MIMLLQDEDSYKTKWGSIIKDIDDSSIISPFINKNNS